MNGNAELLKSLAAKKFMGRNNNPYLGSQAAAGSSRSRLTWQPLI